MTVFVPIGAEGQGLTATWLLYSADENDIDRRSIKTTRGGFNIPDELAEVLGLVETSLVAFVAPVPEIPVDVDEDAVAPEGWDEPLPTPDVALGADGKVYLTDEAAAREAADELVRERVGDVVEPSRPFVSEPAEVDREVIRAWAKDNGYDPAEKGALKKSVVEAYNQAHSEG